ncbi:MAG: ABC transporter ATP-binding protein [Clostridia bacterium]|nr:ABC transporter ATP-binding protein [Clostridia bacterium]
MGNIIEIKNLSKHFGDIKAVDDISFSVSEGELFAFLGVNGAGKSTTISIICGTLARDSGEASICGLDIDRDADKVKRLIGVVFQNSVLDKDISVKDNLRYRAALYGICGNELEIRLKELSELLDLEPLMKRTLKKLSGGQKRRIDIARALLHRPKILFLDEPTTGLDPQTRRTVWSAIEKLRAEDGMTVFLTTHYMEEAADADNVVIIEKGRIAAEGTPHELKSRYTGDFITLYGVSGEDIKKLGMPFTEIGDSKKIAVPNTAYATELILKYPELFRDYEIVKGGMDDVFLAVTGYSGNSDEETAGGIK